MKSHVFRPLFVAVGAVAAVLTLRSIMVPADFGVHGARDDGKNFTFSFHRLSSIDEWKAFPVKYKDKAYCNDCHEDRYAENMSSPHKIIECENCHGPALAHPDKPEKLEINRSRELCLRCHALLPYPRTLRGKIKGIDPDTHNKAEECVSCHNPHNPSLEGMK